MPPFFLAMSKAKKQQPRNPQGGRGRGGVRGRGSSSRYNDDEDVDLWTRFCEKERAKEEAQNRSELTKSIKEELMRSGPVLKGAPVRQGALKRSKKQVVLSEEEEDDIEDHDLTSSPSQHLKQLSDQVVELKVDWS